MKLRKAMARLENRRKQFDTLSPSEAHGRTRPGSLKKSQPLGKRR